MRRARAERERERERSVCVFFSSLLHSSVESRAAIPRGVLLNLDETNSIGPCSVLQAPEEEIEQILSGLRMLPGVD